MENVEEIIRYGEDSCLELKSVRVPGKRVTDPDTKDVADEFAAAANSSRTVFYFGIDDKTRRIEGIPADKLDVVETWIRDICNDSVKPAVVATIRKVATCDAVGNPCCVLRVDVPKSLFVHEGPHGYFYRIGSSKRKMPPEMLARLFQQRSQTRFVCFDEQIVSSAMMSDLKLQLYRRFKTEMSAADDNEFLRKLHYIAKDEDGVWHPTVAGVLFACDSPEEFLPSAYLQAVCYRGTERNANDQLDARDIKGPLDVQVAEACRFVMRNMRVSAIKRPMRIDIPQYPMNAVFEAIVNAVAHRDYSISGAKIRLHMFSDRIELFSPGGLPNSLTLDEIGERQFARNELICTSLSRCPLSERVEGVTRRNLMDRRGEGVPVILSASRKLTANDATYKLFGDSELLLTIPSVDYANKESLERAAFGWKVDIANREVDFPPGKVGIGVRDGDDFSSKVDIESVESGLSPRMRSHVLSLREKLSDKAHFRRADVIAALGLSKAGASKLLQRLAASGVIVAVSGFGKGTYRFA